MERYPYNSSFNHLISENPGFLSDLDKDKFLSVFRKVLPWIILIFVLTNLTAYLVIRWTKPVFEAYSDLKLDVKSEASVLGLNGLMAEEDNANKLAGEIEIIRSKLFFNKVIESLDLETSYYNYGNVLNEERYHTSPFRALYVITNPAMYDKNIDIDILSEKRYRMTYVLNEKEITGEYNFNEKVETSDLVLELKLKENVDQESLQLRYFFRANSRPALLSYLDNNLSVEPLNYNANIIRIRFKDHNVRKATDLVNAIDTLYLRYTIEEKNKVNLQKINFLNEQLENTSNKLEEYESYFENFTIQNKTVNLDTDISRTITLLEELDSARFQTGLQLEKIKELKQTLNREEENSFLLINAAINPSFAKRFEEYNTLINERSLLRNSYNENTFAVKKFNQKLAGIKTELNDYLDQWNNNLQEQLKRTNQQKTALENSFVTLPAKGTSYNKVKRFYALYEQFYLSLMQKKTEFEIAQAGITTDFKILSSASASPNPITPKVMLIHGIGFVSGLIISILIVFVGYAMHNSISSQNEIELLTKAPLLGVVPYYSLEKLPETGLIVNKRPKSSISESLRTIRTNMEFLLNTDKSKKVISFTSTISGEGKSFIAANMGAILAFSGHKVLLVDLDMRKPRVHTTMGQEASDKGLSSILINRYLWEDALHQSEVENYHFITSGPTPPNSSELIGSPRFAALVEEWKQQYDYILFDTPPVGLVSDGLVAMKLADLQLYIIRADYSKKAFINTVNKLIAMPQFEKMALILNSLKTNSNRGYGYGYGYGAGYYEEPNAPKGLRAIWRNWVLRR